MESEYGANVTCWAKNIFKISVLTLHSALFLLQELYFLPPELSNIATYSVKSRFNTAKDSTQQNENFQSFELKIEFLKQINSKGDYRKFLAMQWNCQNTF
jgi:hypothetical protein